MPSKDDHHNDYYYFTYHQNDNECNDHGNKGEKEEILIKRIPSKESLLAAEKTSSAKSSPAKAIKKKKIPELPEEMDCSINLKRSDSGDSNKEGERKMQRT